MEGRQVSEAEEAGEVIAAFRRMGAGLIADGFRPVIVAEAMLAAAQGVYAEKVADRRRVGPWLRSAALAADGAALAVSVPQVKRRC